jgi:hypothetical protein
MVFAYVKSYLFGGNKMLAAFYMWRWSLHIVYRVDTGWTGPDLTLDPVHWISIEIRSSGSTGSWMDPG